MHPRIPIAFLAIRAHRWGMLTLLSTRTPSSFSTELLSNLSVPNLYWYMRCWTVGHGLVEPLDLSLLRVLMMLRWEEWLTCQKTVLLVGSLCLAREAEEQRKKNRCPVLKQNQWIKQTWLKVFLMGLILTFVKNIWIQTNSDKFKCRGPHLFLEHRKYDFSCYSSYSDRKVPVFPELFIRGCLLTHKGSLPTQKAKLPKLILGPFAILSPASAYLAHSIRIETVWRDWCHSICLWRAKAQLRHTNMKYNLWKGGQILEH